jgi:hypothetical protein
MVRARVQNTFNMYVKRQNIACQIPQNSVKLSILGSNIPSDLWTYERARVWIWCAIEVRRWLLEVMAELSKDSTE